MKMKNAFPYFSRALRVTILAALVNGAPPASADYIPLRADAARLAEIDRLAAPVGTIVLNAAGARTLRATVVDFRKVPEPDGYEITVRAWSRPANAAEDTPVTRWSEPFVVRGREIWTVHLDLDDVFDLRVMLSDVDRHTDAFGPRWRNGVSAILDHGDGGSLGLFYEPETVPTTPLGNRMLKGTLIEYLLHPPDYSRQPPRPPGPRPLVIPAWEETLRWDVRDLGRMFAHARATVVLWPDAEARVKRFVPAANAAVQFIASLGRLPLPPIYDDAGNPLEQPPISRRRSAAVTTASAMMRSFVEEATQAAYPSFPWMKIDASTRARLKAEIDGIDDPFVREKQGMGNSSLFRDDFPAVPRRTMPWHDALVPSDEASALATLGFFADCPELWGLTDSPESDGYSSGPLVTTLIALAADPRCPTITGAIVPLPWLRSNDPVRTRLTAEARHVLGLLLRPDLQHPALGALAENDRVALEDRIVAGAAKRREAFARALWSDKPWIVLNAIELLELWSREPGRLLINRHVLFDQWSSALSSRRYEVGTIPYTDHRFRQQITARLCRVVLRWKDPKFMPAERNLAAELEPKVKRFLENARKESASADEKAFAEMLEKELGLP